MEHLHLLYDVIKITLFVLSFVILVISSVMYLWNTRKSIRHYQNFTQRLEELEEQGEEFSYSDVGDLLVAINRRAIYPFTRLRFYFKLIAVKILIPNEYEDKLAKAEILNRKIEEDENAAYLFKELKLSCRYSSFFPALILDRFFGLFGLQANNSALYVAVALMRMQKEPEEKYYYSHHGYTETKCPLKGFSHWELAVAKNTERHLRDIRQS